MSSSIGKKNIAYKGSNHGAASPPAASLVSPPAPPAPAAFPYTCRAATAAKTAPKYRVNSYELMIEGSTMDIDPPANEPARPTSGDILTHATSNIAVMTMGSLIMHVCGKGVCGTGDIVAMNVMNARMFTAQMMVPLLEGADFETASKSNAAAAAMNEKYWRAYHPERAKQTKAGDPVDLGTGFVVDEAIDLELPGPVQLTWLRTYSSAFHKRKTALGKGGWTHSFEQWIEVTESGVRLHDEEGLPVDFPAPPPHGKSFHRGRRLELSAVGRTYEIRSLTDRLTRTFSPLPGGKLALTSIRSSRLHQIKLEYEGDSLARIIDSVKREIRLKNDDKGRVTRVEVWASDPGSGEPASLQTWFDYAYHPEGELASCRNALGHGRSWEYDGLHRLKKVTLPNGVSFYFEYDPEHGRCVRTWGDGGLHDVRIDIDFQKGETRTHGTNQARRYFFTKGIVTREETYTGDWATEWAYDEDELLLSQANGAGEATAYAYDARGNLVQETDPAGNKTLWEIDDDLPVKHIDPAGLTTRYDYDAHGSLIGLAFPDGRSYRIDRDREGRVSAVYGPEGALAALAYDEHGNLTVDTSARGATMSYRYDALGRAIEQIDAIGRASRVKYDLLGRVVEAARADGSTVRATYDELGKPSSATDALGRVTKLEHVGTGVLGRLIQPDGQVYGFRYDSDERLVEICNPRLETYQFDYDRADQVIAERTFDDQLITYRYNRAGRVTRIDYPEQEWRELAYDKLGNLVEDRGSDVELSFQRDAMGRVIKAACQDMTGKVVTEFERDRFGRITADIQNGRAVRYEYDSMGRRSARILPDGERTDYHYDLEGALAGVTHEGRRLSIERDALGRERTRQAKGWKVDSEYDSVDRLLSQRVTAPDPGGGAPRALAERRYGYDAAGRVASVESLHGGLTIYRYDPINQLVEAQRGRAREVFEYDPTGSLTNILRDLGEAGRRAAWSLSPGNRLIATDRARYVNDGRGRRIRRAEPTDGKDPRGRAPRGDERVTTYGWDTKDRLREVALADGVRVRFTYDAFGRRVRKDVLPASPAPVLLDGPSGATPEARAVKRTVTFLWDGDVLCEEQDSSKSSDARKRIHVHEPGTFIPLIQSEQGEVFGVINDHLGMPKELVDESGRIAWRAQHGAWGDLREVERDRGAAAVQSPFRLLGHYFDEETSLCYTRFRYFCAGHGRWLSSDPLGIVGGLNLHAFDGSPSAVVDPWGLAPELDPKECMNPKDINFSQRSINRRFDTPKGKIPMQTAINAGPEQVKSFPPIPVMIVKGQVVALNGNSRLLIAQETGAPLIRVQIVSGPEAYRELAKRTRDNGLPITGTREQPTPR